MIREWSYRVDREDRVAEVGPGWDDFARENDAPGAMADQVVGRPFLDFVDGVSTRKLLRTLLDAVRERGETLEIPFRCDSPTERRFMNWSGRAEPDGGVRIATQLLGTGEREALPLYGTDGPRNRSPVRMCSWCNRLAAGPGLWLEPESAAQRLGLFLDREVPSITHGICPRCRVAVEGAPVVAGEAR